MFIVNRLEELANQAANDGIAVVDYKFHSQKIKGLYCDNTIALNVHISSNTEKACILAEEMGHYYTSSGNIIDLSVLENRKQEYRARLWAYDKIIGLPEIVRALKKCCKDICEMAEYLDVTEEFLTEAINCYRGKYGTSIKFKEYIINFDPYLYVIKMA